jgi:hypothetical protein
MKGKRHAIEDKIRILREADGGRIIQEICREHNLSEVSFHRWKLQFGQIEIHEARRLKDDISGGFEVVDTKGQSHNLAQNITSRHDKKMTGVTGLEAVTF